MKRRAGPRASWPSARQPSETIFDLPGKGEEIARLEELVAAPDLWNDASAAQSALQKLSRLKEEVGPVRSLQGAISDVEQLAEMAAAEEDGGAGLGPELSESVMRLHSEVERLETEVLLSGEYDARNALVEINAGAGGTESCDWVQILLRMYVRWAQDRGYAVEIADEQPGDVAGLKSVVFEVIGRSAYGYLQGERGVHRLVRISPFDSAKRRHTSFASVDVIPEVGEAEAVAIGPDDLRVDTYRASGAGGQHVNKTDSAVRITHLPTGIVVTCQNERSQHKNRLMALKVLQARLMERERRANEAKLSELRGEQQAIEWGNQIRSYVFQPYTLVKDHRTGYETGDVIRTMDGAIDPFLQAYLQWQGGRK
ncbi:MAG TPA: peptide chain release factor 2 [Chthonomonadales bacterium]|nr:peptide chain release factor 2 [Chthonomonadales bacterium]